MFSKNLRLYRLRAGMTREAIAEECGVTLESITHYEAGDCRPGMETFLKVCNVLNVSLADLLRRRSALAFEHGSLRKDSHMNCIAREFVRESVEEHLCRLHDALVCLGGDVLPPAPACGCLPLIRDVTADAATLRRHLGVEPLESIPDVVGLLEDRGILVVELGEVDECFTGMSGFDDSRPYVAINASMSPEHTRSGIAHELTRLMFDWEDIQDVEQEAHATAIAGAFLLSAVDAVREPTDVYLERPRLLERLVCQAVREDAMSVQRGAELLRLSFDQVTRASGLCGA